MAVIDGMLLEIEDYTTNANQVKDLVLERMILDNRIDSDQAAEYQEKWQVIIVKKSWFKSWADKFSKEKKNEYLFKFVRFEE
jgi:hypothetical protein